MEAFNNILRTGDLDFYDAEVGSTPEHEKLIITKGLDGDGNIEYSIVDPASPGEIIKYSLEEMRSVLPQVVEGMAETGSDNTKF